LHSQQEVSNANSNGTNTPNTQYTQRLNLSPSANLNQSNPNQANTQNPNQQHPSNSMTAMIGVSRAKMRLLNLMHIHNQTTVQFVKGCITDAILKEIHMRLGEAQLLAKSFIPMIHNSKDVCQMRVFRQTMEIVSMHTYVCIYVFVLICICAYMYV